jgi:hypothetical protein
MPMAAAAPAGCSCHHFSETAKKDISKLARSIILVGYIISVATKQNRTEFIMAPTQNYPYCIYTGESDELDELPDPLRRCFHHKTFGPGLSKSQRISCGRTSRGTASDWG